jgi:hypothetical protein
VRNFHKHLCNVYENGMVDRRTVGCWVKRVMASEIGKVELHDLPHLGCPVTGIWLEVL